MYMRLSLILIAGLLAGCVAPTGPTGVPGSSTQQTGTTPGPVQASFAAVVARVEPVAERVCLSETRGVRCDFEIVLDRRPGQSANAYQSLSSSGQPVLTVTSGLIADMANDDELAFVLSHEAAHHILGHLARQEQNAAAGAVIFAGLAAMTGGSQADVDAALELGAAVGARSYSKDFELEADGLGTAITYYAGYDPLRGADYFTRLPDPGNRFLGSHPPNADRIATVRRTMAQIQ